MSSQIYQDPSQSRSRRRFGYLADIVRFVNPFDESAARRAEANAASAMRPHQQIIDIDSIIKGHTPLSGSVSNTQQ
ncbi:MAG: hypothetical protein U0516_01370 [Candidatus Saccharibacteria bacterium]